MTHPRGKILTSDFFAGDVVAASRALLGKLLVRRDADGGLRIGRVVETEAYLAEGDAACHAYKRKTPRNAVMFGPSGYAYVYFIYGMHWCLNVSCGPQDMGSAVLVRALEPVAGVERMIASRGLPEGARPRSTCGGPARLAQALEVTRERDNGKNMLNARSDLHWRDDGYICGDITATPRIGITQAVDLPLRFVLSGHACLSR